MGKPDIKKDYTINERVKFIRKKAHLTQAEFADSIGIKQATMSDIERNKIGVSTNLISAISDKYDVDINWIMTGNNGIKIANSDISFSVEAKDLDDYNEMCPSRQDTYKDIDDELNNLIYTRLAMMDYFIMSILCKLENLLTFDKSDPEYSDSVPFSEAFEKEQMFLSQFNNPGHVRPTYFDFPTERKLMTLREIDQATERMLSRARIMFQNLEFKYYSEDT